MAGTTEVNNTVTLNGVAYAVKGPVRQQPASEFQAGLRTGSPQYDDRLGAFILTLEDSSGGLGVLNADERKNEHMRVRYGTAETRFPKLFTLPGLVTSTTLTGVAFPSGIPIGRIRQWKDVLIIAAGTKCFKMNSSLTVSDITATNKTTEIGANGETTDLIVHDFNDGFFANQQAMLWTFKNTTGSYQYYVAAADDPVAASWSPQGRGSNPGDEIHSMVSYDQKVLKMQGAFMKESNEGTGGTWGDLAVSPFDPDGLFMTVPLYSTFIGVHRVPFGPDFMPWMLLPYGEVAMLDYWARQLKPLELNLGRISDGYMMDEGVILSNTYDLFKLIPSDPPAVVPLGIRRGQGLDQQYTDGIVSGIGSMGGQLVCGFTNLKTGGSGRVWIMMHNGAGWHVLAEQSIDSCIVLDIWTYEKPAGYFGFRSAAYLCWLTWDGTTAKLHYIQQPIGNGSPEQDPTYKYAAAGVYETPWMYGGFEDLYGALLRLRVRGQTLSSTETIVVKYRIDEDDTSAWTTLGTFTNSTTELSWGTNGVGVQFKSVRFRFEFARGATTTTTPKARAFILLYDKKPVTRRAYSFTVDVSRMKNEQKQTDSDPWTGFTSTLDFKEVLDKLVTLKDTYTLVSFTYDNEGTRYVKIQALPSQEQEIHDSMREGVIQVQVSEVIG